jgi:hypothetical protein
MLGAVLSRAIFICLICQFAQRVLRWWRRGS